MKKTLIALLFFISLFVELEAQQMSNATFQSVDSTDFQELIGEEYLDPGFTNKGIYWIEDWLPGSIILKSNRVIDNVMLRYNSFDDDLIWLSKQHGQVKLNNETIKEFTLKNSNTEFRFVVAQPDLKNNVKDSYLQLCFHGKVKVYIKRKAKPYTNNYKRNVHYYFYKPDPEYYLFIKDAYFKINKPTIKAVVSIFPQLRSEINQRAKELHLVAKDEKAFIHFIEATEDILLKAR